MSRVKKLGNVDSLSDIRFGPGIMACQLLIKSMPFFVVIGSNGKSSGNIETMANGVHYTYV
jgi:hypothetical protein